MTTRTYDLSENVVPHQGEEAIADTPSPESPSATTEEKRNEEDLTDPTNLDSNPASEDETRSPSERTDVTNLAARRAQAKRVPRLSTQAFSDVCKIIDRTASANPKVDFGKVVVHAVREYAYKANTNTLRILAAVVPVLITSGNFDVADRESLIKLNDHVIAQQKKEGISGVDTLGDAAGGGTDPSAAGGAAPGGAAGGDSMTSPMSQTPPPAGGSAGAPTDPSAAGGAPPTDPSQQQQMMAKKAAGDPGGIGNALMGDFPGAGNEYGGLSQGGGTGLPSGVQDAAQDLMAGGGIGQAIGDVTGLGDESATSLMSGGLSSPGEIAQQNAQTAASVKTANNPPATNAPAPGGPAETNDVDPNQAGGGTAANPLSGMPNPAPPAQPVPATRQYRIKRGRSVHANGTLHFDTGGPESPVPVTHLQDHGDGTSLIHNEAGQPEAVNNEDLYHDPQMQMPVTQPHPKNALPETSPEKQKKDAPPTGAPGGSQGQQYPTPPNKNSRRASGDTNADGADPEDVREENKDNTVGPDTSFTRDPGDDLSDKTSAFSRRADAADDNMEAAKKNTETKDVEKPSANSTSDRGQQSQYDLGEYNQNGPQLTDPDKSTDQNWPPKASAVDAIRLADMYVDFGLIEPEQKYQVVAGFEKMNKFIVQDRLKVLTAVASVKRPERNRALVPQASNTNGHRTNGSMPSMQRGSSLKEATRDVGDHFLAL